MARKRIDPLFVLCCKEEIADGERLCVTSWTQRERDALIACFTDEELEHIDWVIAPAAPAPESGTERKDR